MTGTLARHDAHEQFEHLAAQIALVPALNRQRLSAANARALEVAQDNEDGEDQQPSREPRLPRIAQEFVARRSRRVVGEGRRLPLRQAVRPLRKGRGVRVLALSRRVTGRVVSPRRIRFIRVLVERRGWACTESHLASSDAQALHSKAPRPDCGSASTHYRRTRARTTPRFVACQESAIR